MGIILKYGGRDLEFEFVSMRIDIKSKTAELVFDMDFEERVFIQQYVVTLKDEEMETFVQNYKTIEDCYSELRKAI